jgi:deoxycytidine triphosphate deaminase
MEPLSGKEAASRVTGLVSAKHQVHGYSVDLTVKNIFALDPTGRVDFGGGEYMPAGRMAVDPLRRNPEDKYQWWELGRGCYFIEFNESLELPADEMALLEPDERLLRAGASHTSNFLRGRIAPVEALLQVGALTMLMKQNARVSRLRVFKLAAAPALVVTPAMKVASAPKKATKKKK